MEEEDAEALKKLTGEERKARPWYPNEKGMKAKQQRISNIGMGKKGGFQPENSK